MGCICITVTDSVICPSIRNRITQGFIILLKDDLMKLDKITDEVRLLGRENISTDEQRFFI